MGSRPDEVKFEMNLILPASLEYLNIKNKNNVSGEYNVAGAWG
jgi:hypothetical protein